MVDTVTSWRANLHNELITLLQQAEQYKATGHLYAAAYRPMCQDENAQIALWLNELELGESLPTMPLALAADWTAPVELEKTYVDVCGRRLPTEYSE